MRLKPLSGLDAGFLYLEAAGTPMHVGSLMLLTPPKKRGYDFHQALTDLIAERLPKARALKRKLVDAPLELAHPMWGEATQIDLEEHIRRERLPHPGSETQLLRRVAELHADPLPRDRPLWRLVVIEGLASGEVAMYSKVHHALLDGQGGVALAQVVLDLEPRIPPKRKVSVSEHSAPVSQRAVASTALRATINQFAKVLRAVPATLKLAGQAVGEASALMSRAKDALLLAPRTPLNVHIGSERSYAIQSLPLDDVKRVAKGLGVSVNDVVLALVAGAMREYLKRLDALPDEPLVVGMPVSLRSADNSEVNNQVSMVQCPLPTNLGDPLERLRAIHLATRDIKGRVSAFKDLIPTDFPGLAAPMWAAGLSRLWARGKVAERLPPLANLVISNVPGPPVDLYLAGAKLHHYFPVSIVTHGLALNITVHSYGGSMDFGLIAARDVVPRPDSIAKGLQRALTALLKKVPA